MERRLSFLNYINLITIDSKCRPATYSIKYCLMELNSTTFTSLNDKGSILHIKLSSRQLIESILNKLQGECIVRHSIRYFHLLIETSTHTDNLTRLTNVKVLTIHVSVRTTKCKNIVLIIIPLLLKLPLYLMHPHVYSILYIATISLTGYRNTKGNLLTKHSTRNLVMNSNGRELISHSHWASKTNITCLTGELPLYRSILYRETLTWKQLIYRNTSSNTTHQLTTIYSISAFISTIGKNPDRINLITLTNNNLLICKPILSKYQIEWFTINTYIILTCCNYLTISITCFYQRNISGSTTNNIPCILFIRVKSLSWEL